MWLQDFFFFYWGGGGGGGEASNTQLHQGMWATTVDFPLVPSVLPIRQEKDQ